MTREDNVTLVLPTKNSVLNNKENKLNKIKSEYVIKNILECVARKRMNGFSLEDESYLHDNDNMNKFKEKLIKYYNTNSMINSCKKMDEYEFKNSLDSMLRFIAEVLSTIRDKNSTLTSNTYATSDGKIVNARFTGYVGKASKDMVSTFVPENFTSTDGNAKKSGRVEVLPFSHLLCHLPSFGNLPSGVNPRSYKFYINTDGENYLMYIEFTFKGTYGDAKRMKQFRF